MHTHVIQRFIDSHALPQSYADDAELWFVPLAEELVVASKHNESIGSAPFVLGISGCQGSGKSTASELLETLLLDQGLVVARLSLDDFYLSRRQREELASIAHPLLVTRGVPGTHDIGHALKTLEALRDTHRSSGVALPRFDKPTDNPLPSKEWPMLPARHNRPAADILIFEGWCLGVTPQSASELAPACNSLEQEEDQDGHWRGFVNEKLAGDYQSLFSKLDRLLFLEAPNFECVLNWRIRQEARLRTHGSRSSRPAPALMSEAQVERFVQHFERLTRHCLLQLSSVADTVFELDTNQRIVGRR